ncbi:MAG: DUF2914 domain-containing protein [Bradymonadaceae bacterium]
MTLWMAVRNPSSPSNLQVTWSVGGNEVHTYDLEIGQSARWRTWATMRVARAGEWTAEIKNGQGTTLETVTFTVSGS